MKHVFAICAYGKSPYLEACIRSLKAQSHKSEIILCTSTSSEFIKELAKKYEINVYVRDGMSQIRDDWNFAYECAAADLVTIAHQDDLYRKNYAETVRNVWMRYPDTTVMMTDAAIIRNGKVALAEPVKLVKKVLRLPLRLIHLSHKSLIKKSVLMFGNPIICPSCTYHKRILGTPLFDSPYQFALDWDTMLRLSARPGRWVCVERPLMYYRIHQQATTKVCIKDHKREQEEAEIFRQLWPPIAAKWILKLYQLSYKSYD